MVAPRLGLPARQGCDKAFVRPDVATVRWPGPLASPAEACFNANLALRSVDERTRPKARSAPAERHCPLSLAASPNPRAEAPQFARLKAKRGCRAPLTRSFWRPPYEQGTTSRFRGAAL